MVPLNPKSSSCLKCVSYVSTVQFVTLCWTLFVCCLSSVLGSSTVSFSHTVRAAIKWRPDTELHFQNWINYIALRIFLLTRAVFSAFSLSVLLSVCFCVSRRIKVGESKTDTRSTWGLQVALHGLVPQSCWPVTSLKFKPKHTHTHTHTHTQPHNYIYTHTFAAAWRLRRMTTHKMQKICIYNASTNTYTFTC